MCGNLFDEAKTEASEETPPTSSQPHGLNRFSKSNHSVGCPFTAGLLCATNDFQRICEHLRRGACDRSDDEMYSSLISVQRRRG